MRISDFTDERISEVRSGRSPLTQDERDFLIRDTPTFEECAETAADLAQMTDADLIATAYGVWADYASCL
jgi:hypothetical protein